MGIDLEQFLVRLDIRTQAEMVLAVMYHSDRVLLVRQLTPKAIRDAIEQSRQAVPSNISQVLSGLRQRKLINRAKDGSYSLTNAGIDRIEKKVEEAGIRLDNEVVMTLEDISETLHKKTLGIASVDERRYVEEAIRCLHPSVVAFRAAVLMGWTAAIYHLRKRVECIGFSDFNAAFRKVYPQSKRKPANHFDDLEDYKDIELLEVCEELRLYDKAVKKRLLSWLDLRNGCGHPTNVIPEIHIVKAFFEEIVEYVLAK